MDESKSFKEEPMFSVSYNKYLQDIAGNVLSVNITEQQYDPVAERIVRGIADKVDDIKIEVDNVKSDGYSVSLKIDKEIANQAHAVPMVAKINGLDPADFPAPPKLKRSDNMVYDV